MGRGHGCDYPSDSEEDLSKQGSIGNARPITGLSRRTKASSPNASRSSYLKAKGTSEASSTMNYGAERKSSSTEALRKPSSQTQIPRHPSSEKIFSPITLHLSIAIDVPLIFKDGFSISLQDDILEAQRLAQRDQGRGPLLQKQKDEQHLPLRKRQVRGRESKARSSSSLAGTLAPE
ncbi:hypothetical protein FH972_013831 [Carpinus fangiana]|uniref:Uncharacterized protein n=1 Tax=Carpinus fangiana TaxID=176857 RepID=A0A5N6RAH4_9ROSI|nr:hypothetical protein FH972_013831 [Carpinus fangiana]